MPEPKLKSVSKPRQEKKAALTQDEINEVLFPEMSADEFCIGSRKFRIRCLPYKFEQMFRKHAMPIIQAEFKPIERIIFSYTTKEALITNDLHITESIGKSEIDADVYLLNAMIVICLSQDKRILEAQASGTEVPLDEMAAIEKNYRIMIEMAEKWPTESPRHYIRDVVRRQSDKMKLVQSLGESLMARCEEAAKLVGMNETFSTLKQGFTERALSFLGKAGNAAGIPGNSFLPSTVTGSETSQPAAPSKNSGATQEPPEAAPVEEQVEQASQPVQ